MIYNVSCACHNSEGVAAIIKLNTSVTPDQLLHEVHVNVGLSVLESHRNCKAQLPNFQHLKGLKDVEASDTI